MAPQQASGKRKEDFVKWKDSHATIEGGQSNVGGTSSSVARRLTPTSRPQSTVTEHIQQQDWSDSEEPPQNQVVTEIDRDGELDVSVGMQRPPPVPKQIPSRRFVPPRTSTRSPSTIPRSTSGNSPHNNTRQASSSPLGRPLQRLAQSPEYTVDNDTCKVQENFWWCYVQVPTPRLVFHFLLSTLPYVCKYHHYSWKGSIVRI